MKFKIFALCLFMICALLLTACGDREPDPNDRETFPPENYETVADAPLAHRGGLSMTDYASDSTAGAWIAKCAEFDRDEQFDVYSLRRKIAAEEGTTFTYLLYYPHGGSSLTASVELLEGEGGYVLNVTYASGGSSGGYCLDYVTVTLPTDKAPRLRLLYDGQALGQLATVTDKEF